MAHLTPVFIFRGTWVALLEGWESRSSRRTLVGWSSQQLRFSRKSRNSQPVFLSCVQLLFLFLWCAVFVQFTYYIPLCQTQKSEINIKHTRVKSTMPLKNVLNHLTAGSWWDSHILSTIYCWLLICLCLDLKTNNITSNDKQNKGNYWISNNIFLKIG